MKTSRVLLINPNRIQPPVAPLGLEYLAAALEDWGIAAELLDLAWENDPLAAVRERLLQGRYLAAGISVRNTDDCSYSTRDFLLPQIKELVGTLKSLTESPVVLGGCGFSIMPKAVLSYCGADYGLTGDGEATLPAFLAALKEGHELHGLNGLVYHKGERIAANPPCCGRPC